MATKNENRPVGTDMHKKHKVKIGSQGEEILDKDHRDDGYDVMDYFQIDPQLGSMEDFMELVDHSRVRGIKRI